MLWTSDHDHESWTEGGAGLSGGSHESQGKVFVEVKCRHGSSFCSIARKSCNLVVFQGVMALRPRNHHLRQLSLCSVDSSMVGQSGSGPCQGGECR